MVRRLRSSGLRHRRLRTFALMSAFPGSAATDPTVKRLQLARQPAPPPPPHSARGVALGPPDATCWGGLRGRLRFQT
eukprot:10340517-Alexandrium_andersonii.AAC.1